MFIVNWIFQKLKPVKAFDPGYEWNYITDIITRAKTNLIYRKNTSFWIFPDCDIIPNISINNIDLYRNDKSIYREYIQLLKHIINPCNDNLSLSLSLSLSHESKLNDNNIRNFVDRLNIEANEVTTNFRLSYIPMRVDINVDLAVFDDKNHGILIDIKEGWFNGVSDAKWGKILFQALACQHNGIKIDRIAIYDPLTYCLFMVKIPIYNWQHAKQIIDFGINKSS